MALWEMKFHGFLNCKTLKTEGSNKFPDFSKYYCIIINILKDVKGKKKMKETLGYKDTDIQSNLALKCSFSQDMRQQN